MPNRHYGVDPEPSGRERQRLLAIVCPPGSLCWLCGEPIIHGLRPRHSRGPSMDHVLPRIHGGTWELDNLKPAHFGCNSGRRERAPKQVRVRSRVW
ncbi:MAG: HNH endonuclease [Actinobacteria bacterium]|nr:HNH endonuclease [Actinomycetota bacterium]